jgi:hypothetical protein
MSDDPSKPVSDPVADFVKALPGLPARIHRSFRSELLFRLFVVGQGIGVVALIYLTFGYKQCFTPPPSQWGLAGATTTCWGWGWAYLFDADQWGSIQNWLVILAILGPYLIFKSVDWVSAGRVNT